MSPSLSAISEGLRVEIRVIHALFMREILTRFGRHNIGFLWMFVEPMTFTLGVTALWTATKSVHGSNLPITAFALTGYSTVLLWRNMPSRCIGAILPNLSLMFHRNVKVFDIFMARLVLEGAGATMSFIILGCFFIGFEMIAPPEDLLLVAVGWTMTAWFGISLALFLGALCHEYELVDKFWHPFSYLMFPLSGAGFLVEALPTNFQKWILYLPMVNGVECLRDGFFGTQFHAHYDLGYMATCNAILTLLAMAQVRRINSRIIPQ